MDSSDSGPMHTFVTWFYQHKYSLLKQSMLKYIRRKAGLGDPPGPFTTNSSESINSLLKSRMDYKKNECTKVQNPRRPRVRKSLNACANAGKARAIETQGWLCTLLEALLL